MYGHGARLVPVEGMVRDPDEGARHLRFAVEQGEPNAMLTLANQLAQGRAPAAPGETPFALYRRAAELRPA